MMHDSDEFESWMQEEYGPKVAPKLIEYCYEVGWAAEFMSGKWGLRWLRGKIDRMREAVGANSNLRRKRKPEFIAQQHTASREETLSIICAATADKDDTVVYYRETALNGQLLKWEEVEDWIDQRSQKEGASTIWITVPLPKQHKLVGSTISPQLVLKTLPSSRTKSRRFLYYATPTDDWSFPVAVAEGGSLDELRLLGQRLANRYGWQEQQAVIFVLTGNIPRITPISSVTTERNNGGVEITLKLDPGVSPAEVERYYRALRQGLYGNHRIKSLSEKHHRLAIVATHKTADDSWDDLFKGWNKQVPKKWRYREQSNFRRDALKARARLLAVPMSKPLSPDFSRITGV